MNFLKKVSQFIDDVNRKIGACTSWLTLVLVVLICLDVFSRYALNVSKIWVFELEWHLFALIFLLAAGHTYAHNRHVRVDLFYAKRSLKGRVWIDLLGNVFFLIPWCIITIYTAYQFASNSWLMNESSPDPGGLPARYLINYSIVFGFALLLLQSFSEVIKNFIIITSKSKIVD